MNWEQTIKYIRTLEKYDRLVEESYFSEELAQNVENYRKSEEFKTIIEEILQLNPAPGLSILDLGAGNGISSISFALIGYKVTALEPDLSDTVGLGAIEELKKSYNLPNVQLLNCYAEDIPDGIGKFDIVFARQTMHHAYDLDKFISAASKALKPTGILFTIRDHVISNQHEKKQFLKTHPLHHFYGGENAYTTEEYLEAFTKGGFNLIKIFGPSESVINSSPWTQITLKNKMGVLSYFPGVIFIVWRALSYRWERMPGRLYTFIAQKT